MKKNSQQARLCDVTGMRGHDRSLHLRMQQELTVKLVDLRDRREGSCPVVPLYFLPYEDSEIKTCLNATAQYTNG